MKRLTVCIDDFGLHAGVNEAALRLAAAGRVNAISCQVAGPEWRSGAPRLAALALGSIDVGLHLDLTDFTIEPRMRRPLAALIAGAYARRIDPLAVRREIDAQLDAFEAAFGRPPDHADGHRHVHQLPVVREQLIAALDARYASARPWLRISQPPPRRAAARRGALTDTLKTWLIGRLGSATLRDLARAHGFACSARLLGVYDFEGNTPHYEGLLNSWLRQSGPGDLLMCHPGVGVARKGDPIGAARSREFDALAGPGFGRLLEATGTTLAPLSRILAGAASG